ncbi:MAG: CheB methylesterase domain-containing protein, partial [Actinomycetes bacterium]
DSIVKLDDRLIVQHMPAGFTGSLAARLDRMSRLHVREAALGDQLEPGTALVAPGGSHLRLDGRRHARLTDEPPVGGLRPRADLTIADVVAVWGERTLLVVLTGMGRDGAAGLRTMRDRGALTIGQDEPTSVVWGMPAAAAALGAVEVELPLPAIGAAIAAAVRDRACTPRPVAWTAGA